MGSPGKAAADGWSLEGAAREDYVRRLFDRIAGPYDRLNRVISLGRDGAWRRLAVAASGAVSGSRVLDLGTGTGDLALEFARAVGPEGTVVGVDLSPEMLAVAEAKRRRAGVSRLRLHRANAQATGLPDAWADAVSMGWVLRNVGDRAAVYAEVRRVLRPGGRFVCLDMSRPRGPLRRAGFHLFRHLALPLLARLAGGDLSAYRYLAGSTDRFPDAGSLAAELASAGFTAVSARPLMLGAIALHAATLPQGDSAKS